MMQFLGIVAVVLSQRLIVEASPPGSQQRGLMHRAPSYVANSTRTDAVKQTFRIAWKGYYKYAFPHDSLLPVTNNYSDDRNGWGASALDALSTAIVMQQFDIVQQIVEYIPTINFNKSSTEVSLFETTIRYLGGLLSGYDLLTGPFSGTIYNQTLVDGILKQATNLANNLKVAFDTPSGIPDNSLHLDPPRTAKSATNGIATIGTLVLEWTHLSDLLGQPEYGQLAQKGESYLLDPQPQPLAEPFPGLLGINVNLTDGTFLDGTGGWIGGADSFYEYLIKMYVYDPVRFATYKDRWVLAADSTIQYLASTPTTRSDLTFLAYYRNTTLHFVSEHLACFAGGNFILGGLTLDELRYVDFGLKLVDGCYDTYYQTATAIGPEVFQWQDNKLAANATNNPGPPSANDASFYGRAGFWITDASYALRPEVIESIYYAYRATGDVKYQQWAWDACVAINKTTRAGSGFSDIEDVNTKGGGGAADFQETFFFAEVLKYCWLIHAEDGPFQVKADHSNDFVYNTESHPVRIASRLEKTMAEAKEV